MIISADLLPKFEDLYKDDMSWFRLNFGIITLLPKKVVDFWIEKFRPIGLLNISFMFFTKVGTNRLSGIAHIVVSPRQTAFMPSHNILEGVVVLHEKILQLDTKKLDGVRILKRLTIKLICLFFSKLFT